MDKLIFSALSGAKSTMQRQEAQAQNLANLSTPGFRAVVDAFTHVRARGEGRDTRHFAQDVTLGSDFTPGAIQETGRDLDVALKAAGFIAVDAGDGSEAYTRFGALELSDQGVLQTRNGRAVRGEGGEITVPPNHKVQIARDGTVSAVPPGGEGRNVVQLGRIRLVNPPEADLKRGDDGLFRLIDGQDAERDEAVQIVSGALEASNVNPVEAMVNMITLARQFELQTRMMSNAEQNARKANELLNINS